jgi:hypothetical protein
VIACRNGNLVWGLYVTGILVPLHVNVAVCCNDVKPSTGCPVAAAKWRGHNKRAVHLGT